MDERIFLPDIVDELKSIIIENGAGEYTAHDYWISVGQSENESDLAYQWADKKHRHVFDLLNEIVYLRRKLTKLEKQE